MAKLSSSIPVLFPCPLVSRMKNYNQLEAVARHESNDLSASRLSILLADGSHSQTQLCPKNVTHRKGLRGEATLRERPGEKFCEE